MSKSKSQCFQTLINTILILIKLFGALSNATNLMCDELKNIKKYLSSLLFYNLVLLFLLFSSWVCLIAIFYLKMVEYNFSIVSILLSLFGLHLFLLLVVFLTILHIKRSFHFRYLNLKHSKDQD